MQKTVKRAQKGFTLIELLIVIAVIAILAAIAIPNLLASRKAANESSAISSLRTLVTAEETYRSRQTPPAYAGTLAALGTSNLIDQVLAAATATGKTKSGYYFTLTYDATAPNNYSIVATPDLGAGDRYFYVDQTGVLRAGTSSATASDTSAGTNVIQ